MQSGTIMRFFDNHTHSQFSPDSATSMSELADRAVAAGAAGISFTDHLDLEAPRNADKFIFDIKKQQEELRRVAEKHLGKLRISRGIELGLQPCAMNATMDYTAHHDFDVIVASIHFVDGLDPYFGDYYIDKDYRRAYGRVFELIYSTATEYKDFDIIGHFDYIARYAPYEVRDIFYKDFPDELDAILKFLAENGKALEINTKTYGNQRGHIQKLDTAVLRRFRELGGEAVSLGSDSHNSDRVCDKFPYFWEVVKSCGFRNLVCYENRKPVFYNPEKL